MVEKNILPENAEISYACSKNQTIYNVECALHLSDSEELFKMICDFVENKTKKSRDFSITFNKELEEYKTYKEK